MVGKVLYKYEIIWLDICGFGIYIVNNKKELFFINENFNIYKVLEYF